MVHDPWLPIAYRLPDGARTRSVVHGGIDWQIVGIEGGGRALMVRDGLAQRWSAAGLVEDGRLAAFAFGDENLSAISFLSGLVVPVDASAGPGGSAQALAFAAAMKASRAIDPDTPFHDALYVERLGRLLPTYTRGAGMDDAAVLGAWLTGGAGIPTTSFLELTRSLSWSHPETVRDILRAAGLPVDDTAGERTMRAWEGTVRGHGGAPATSTSVSREPFSLPGRVALEAFLREHVVDIVENRDRYRKLGIGFPAAMVLHGPPGCGKTFAVARLVEYLGWPGFHIDAASVASPYIHDTSRKIAGIFNAAADAAPSVVVIDEMEAYLADRNSGIGAGHHRVEEVAEFLRRIPEAAANEVLVVAMTNRLDMIDEAILRRGRFDHIIEVGPAVEAEIEALVTALLAEVPTQADVRPAVLARRLSGRPLSDVAFVVQEGARLAARAGADRVGQADLIAALNSAPERSGTPGRHIGFV